MWALRRAADPLRNNGFAIGISRLCCAKLEVPVSLEGKGSILKSPQAVSVRYQTSDVPSKSLMGRRNISTEAKTVILQEIASRYSTVFEVLTIIPENVSVYQMLDVWFAQRKEVSPKRIIEATLKLRASGMTSKAIQLGDWALANKKIKFNRKLMNDHVRLLSHKYGIWEAKNPVEKRKRILNGLIKIGAFARYPDKNSKINNVQELPTKKQSLTYLAMQYILSKKNKTKFNPVEVVNQLVARDVSGK